MTENDPLHIISGTISRDLVNERLVTSKTQTFYFELKFLYDLTFFVNRISLCALCPFMNATYFEKRGDILAVTFWANEKKSAKVIEMAQGNAVVCVNEAMNHGP